MSGGAGAEVERDGRHQDAAPEGPLLVRLPASGGYHYHVAIKSDGMWRMFGATDRMIYGVEAWAEIPQ